MASHFAVALRRAPRRRLASLALAGAMAALLAAPVSPAFAEDKQPLRILVGFPPGGSADLLARMLGDAMKDEFSSVIVENRPGASGRLALGLAKNARPDGQQVIILPMAPLVLFPHVYRKLDYDPVKDFTPISLLARFQFGITSGPGSNATSVADMIAKIKANPGSGTYGTPGEGSAPHFLGILVGRAANTEFTHVPFQGGAPANNALLGGHIGYKVDVVLESADFHKAGKAKIIAVAGATRDPMVPDVPTLKESGLDVAVAGWFAMIGPAGMSPAVQAKLEKAVSTAMKRPEIGEKLKNFGYEPVGSTAAELAKVQKEDFASWAKPVEVTGFKLD